MDRKTYQQLTIETESTLTALRSNERTTLVANYFQCSVRVGFEIDSRAIRSTITSANRNSPIGNVVSRLM
jgi:hypothetical protein